MRFLTRDDVRALADEPEPAMLVVSPALLAELMGCAIVRPDGAVVRLMSVHRSEDGRLDATFKLTGERGVIGHGVPD